MLFRNLSYSFFRVGLVLQLAKFCLLRDFNTTLFIGTHLLRNGITLSPGIILAVFTKSEHLITILFTHVSSLLFISHLSFGSLLMFLLCLHGDCCFSILLFIFVLRRIRKALPMGPILCVFDPHINWGMWEAVHLCAQPEAESNLSQSFFPFILRYGFVGLLLTCHCNFVAL